MESSGFYLQALLLLGAAVIAAPLFKWIGLGTVLGYLAAGIVIGPLIGIIRDGEEILHFAELGIVFLLFIIGLELKPSRLWQLRKDIFGLGLAQVIVSAALIGPALYFFLNLSAAAAVIAGFGLALSSTAFALQLLEDAGEVNRPFGQRAFSILLFQDLAIVPLLALIPLLAPIGSDSEDMRAADFGIAIGALTALYLAGRFLINPLFRIIANTGAREAMIATALAIVIGAAMLMQMAGLSMAMGAFMAGVLLADSSYRHELEADIEPFRGILLGLFFMAVGLSLDLDVLMENWLTILVLVPFLMLAKAAVLYGLSRLFNSSHEDAVRIALVLPQAGEFGFVLFSAASASFILSSETASLLVAVVTLSMALTPVFARLAPILIPAREARQIEEDYADAGDDVFMIGFSRFGQVASQVLLSGGVEVTIIDNDAERIESAKKFGFRIFFGDGTRRDVLEAAGLRKAKIIAVCTRDRETTDRIVDLVRSICPDPKLFVRSYDRAHSLQLRAKGVDYELRETLESGLVFGKQALREIGHSEYESETILEDVRKRDEARLQVQMEEGLYAGSHMLHTRPVSPEPLYRPKQDGEVIRIDDDDERSAKSAKR